MSKEDMFSRLLELVMSADITDVIGRYTKVIKKGNRHVALCPFHNDTTIGSFYIDKKKGLYNCFSCGAGGNIITFVSKMEELGFYDTVLKLGEMLEYISEDDVKKLKRKNSNKKSEDIAIKTIEKDFKKPKEKEEKRADVDTMDRVYNIFLDSANLSENDMLYLTTERNLEKDYVLQRKYKTYPTRRILSKFLKEIQKEFGSLDVLYGVPGFYEEIKDGQYSWNFMRSEGLAIPIKNADEKIIGLQIRKRKVKEGQSRYVWMTSSFAMYEDNMRHGTVAGAPIDVTYPKKIRNKAVFITEGRFKAEKIAETYGSVAISVQGVSSWKYILDTIKELETSKKVTTLYGVNFSIECIYLAFDADIDSKPQIWQQAKKMTDVIEEHNYPTYYLGWDSSLGKGIDDVINAKQHDRIEKFSKDKYDIAYEDLIELILQKENKELIKDVTPEVFLKHFRQSFKGEVLRKGEISKKHQELLLSRNCG